MKRFIFAGISDKHEFLLYLSKILSSANKKVLLADATMSGKYGYCIGSTECKLRLTPFCGFDVAAGFKNERELEKEIFELGGLAGAYDYLLIDINDLHCGCYEAWYSADAIVWMTTFDRYDIEQSKQWFQKLFKKWPDLKGITVKPVYIQAVDSHLSHEYMMNLMEDLAISWDPEPIIVPWNETNIALQLENTHTQDLKMQPITRAYKRGLVSIIEYLVGWNTRATRRVLRVAERKEA
ncbi:hypothetical protein ABE099_05905 [Paenibacillus turicensis]|uniref:hypothetical protein n=1 Tax=Paenibacillus turicensis TaxID=160487 RepID=UPI003D2D5B1B